MRTRDLFEFIRERHSIYVKKESGLPKPWTKDHILRSYRFCNVYRQLDTQTQWLNDCWGVKHGDDPDYWFACTVFRLVNWHETANQLGYPVPWKSKPFIGTMRTRMNVGLKVYSGAYIVSTHGVQEPKHIYIARQLDKMWDMRDKLRYKEGETLAEFHERLVGCDGLGNFLAAQVVADAKFFGKARKAKDWWYFVAPGPGSKRGLNRVFNRDKDKVWKDGEWLSNFRVLHEAINTLIKKYDLPRLSAQDLQNCLCEFDKYERVRLNEGRPRSTYQGA